MERSRLVGYVAGGVLVLAVAVVLIVVLAGGGDESGDESGGDGGSAATLFPEGGAVAEQDETDLAAAARTAGCELVDTPSRGEADRAHTSGPDESVNHRGNPPTLGRHWPPGYEAQDGLYNQAPADESLVHTMEHGRVIFWVKPSLPEEARAAMRTLFDEDSYQLVMVPRRRMPHAVAATAWNREPEPGGTGRTLGCPRWSEGVVDALRTFRDEHRSNGPEAVP